MTGRRRVIRTASGTKAAAFGPSEWSMLGAIALMWGASFLFISLGLDSLSPPVITLGRLLLGAAALALVPRARRPVDRSDLAAIVVLGVVWMGVPFLLFPIAQQWVDSSIAGIINGSTPLFAGVFAALLLARRPGWAQAWGLALGFCGVVLVTAQSMGGGERSALGMGLLLVAAACYGLALNISVPLVQKYGSLRVVLRGQLAAIAVVAPFGVWGLRTSTVTWPAVGSVAFLGVLSSGLAMVLMSELARRVGATRASVTIYLVPVVAVVLGAALLDERVTTLALAGGVLVLAGAWLSSRRERHEPAPPTTRSVPPGG